MAAVHERVLGALFSKRAFTVALIPMALAGCASLPPAQPARDLAAIAGKWEGAVQPGAGGPALATTLTIKQDGTYESLTPGASSPGPRLVGSVTAVGGKYRFKSDTTGRTGTYTLHEGDGKRVLVSATDDGTVYVEYKPAK